MLKRTWRDETGLANLTAEIIAKAKAEAAARAKPWKEFGARSVNDFDRAEAEAVKAAERGDTVPLARLLFSEYWPQPATLKLVAEIMTGQRWEWTDKQKLVAEITSERRRGKRPVMTQEERRTRNPIHDAAVEVHILKPRLKLLYPEQSRKAVHERAIKIAATRADIDTEKLTRYLARSRSSPQRIK